MNPMIKLFIIFHIFNLDSFAFRFDYYSGKIIEELRGITTDRTDGIDKILKTTYRKN